MWNAETAIDPPRCGRCASTFLVPRWFPWAFLLSRSSFHIPRSAFHVSFPGRFCFHVLHSTFHVPHSTLVPEGSPRLEHVLDPGLSLLGGNQFHEVLALEIEKPLLVHRAAAFDLAAAHH